MKNYSMILCLCVATNFAIAQSTPTTFTTYKAEGKNYYQLNNLPNNTSVQLYNKDNGGEVIARFANIKTNYFETNLATDASIGFAICNGQNVYHLQPKEFLFDNLQITNDGANISWDAWQKGSYEYLLQGSNDGITFTPLEKIISVESKSTQKINVSIINHLYKYYNVHISNKNIENTIQYNSALIQNMFIGTLYPTITTDNTTLLCYQDNCSYQILNAMGQILISGNTPKGKHLISVNSLSQGRYFVQLNNGTLSKTFTLIKY